jgi:acyl-CoA synthetase (AMP-forming)/AMP-acid ligase II
MDVNHLIRESTARWEENTALVQGDRRVTFAQLDERMNRLANGLAAEGVEPGDRVAVLFKNTPELIESFYGIAKHGFVRVPLNYRESERDHVYKLTDSEATALICDADSAPIETLRAEVPSLEHVVCTGETDADARDYETLLAEAATEDPGYEFDEDELFRLAYTGGTTGKPKGVKLTTRNELAELQSLLVDVVNPAQSDVMLHATPIIHASGAFVMPHLLRGATQRLLKDFDTERMVDEVTTHGVTTTFAVPTVVTRLLEATDDGEYDLSSLSTVVYGGAPMPTETLREGIDRFGDVFVQIYGQSEAPMTIGTLPKEAHEEVLRDGETFVWPTTFTEVRIDTGEQTATESDVGEILIRGDQVMAGYLDSPEQTAEVLQNGWLRTGDAGYRDERGRVFVQGRVDDMIITGGYNVHPQEIEEQIHEQLDVSAVSVFGVDSEEWGEAVVAVVVPRAQSLTPEDIRAACESDLASYKVPKQIEIVEELPTTAVGKIDKKALERRFE